MARPALLSLLELPLSSYAFNSAEYFLIAILFLVFDLETIFIYPWCISVSQLNIVGFWSMIDFIFELSIGLFYVWKLGALSWD